MLQTLCISRKYPFSARIMEPTLGKSDRASLKGELQLVGVPSGERLPQNDQCPAFDLVSLSLRVIIVLSTQTSGCEIPWLSLSVHVAHLRIILRKDRGPL